MVRRRERGSSLLLAIVAVFVVSIAAQALHGVLLREVHGFQSERSAVQLRALTDASLAATLARLSEDPGVRRVPRRPLGTGFIESRIRSLGPGAVEVLAIGEAGGRRMTARAVVSLDQTGPQVVRWEASAPSVAARR